MKKIFLAMAALVCNMSMSAQYITVYKDGSIVKTYTSDEADSVVFAEKAPDTHEYVDLGLPSGTLWATCNVGASQPEEYGLYFAWGDTIGYTSDISDGHQFNWANYKWCKGTSKTMTKYCTSSSYGTVDNKTELEAEDDAATANWGSEWQMPSSTQIEELINSSNTTTTWKTQNGVNGRLITSKRAGYTDKSVFLPAAGIRNYASLPYAVSNGTYWSRTLCLDHQDFAYYLDFGSNLIGLYSNNRFTGHTVRPVRVKN